MIEHTEGCEHGVGWDDDCATCDAEIAEAKAAGAYTPNEIGIYFKGKDAGKVEATREAFALGAAWALGNDNADKRRAADDEVGDRWVRVCWRGECRNGCYYADVCSLAACDHEWLDRPESDTRECLICGVER